MKLQSILYFFTQLSYFFFSGKLERIWEYMYIPYRNALNVVYFFAKAKQCKEARVNGNDEKTLPLNLNFNL